MHVFDLKPMDDPLDLVRTIWLHYSMENVMAMCSCGLILSSLVFPYDAGNCSLSTASFLLNLCESPSCNIWCRMMLFEKDKKMSYESCRMHTIEYITTLGKSTDFDFK